MTHSVSFHTIPARLHVVITQASQECLQMFFWNSAVHKSISSHEHTLPEADIVMTSVSNIPVYNPCTQLDRFRNSVRFKFTFDALLYVGLFMFFMLSIFKRMKMCPDNVMTKMFSWSRMIHKGCF